LGQVLGGDLARGKEEKTKMNRRDFFTAVGLLPLLGYGGTRASAAGCAGRCDRLLVLIELKGGSDGLNMAVPYTDPAYYRLRPSLAVERGQVRQLSESTGLHPALSPLMPLWDAGELALVQGVGYAQPNFSHFRSIDIWDTAAASDQYLHDGWLARAFEQFRAPALTPGGVAIGSTALGPLAGSGTRCVALAGANELPLCTAFRERTSEQNMRTACAVIAGGSEVAALRITLNGFDTHSNQRHSETRLLQELAQALASLKAALIEINRWDSTLIMTYSEFGRQAKENPSAGTDHGSTNTHFVAGGAVKGGLYGEAPALNRLDGAGHLPFAIDFRRLYATLLETWWGVASAPILGERFAVLDLLKSPA